MKLRKKVEYWREIKELLDKIEVIVETICYPSEDLEKVKKALLNVLEGEVEIKELYEGRKLLRVKGKGKEAISKIFNGFRSRAVLAAVRKHLKEHTTNNEETVFMLNKQAAYMNVMAIFEEGESALGGIKVILRGKKMKTLIDWLTRF